MSQQQTLTNEKFLQKLSVGLTKPKLTLGSFPGLPGSPGLPCIKKRKENLLTPNLLSTTPVPFDPI